MGYMCKTSVNENKRSSVLMPRKNERQPGASKDLDSPGSYTIAIEADKSNGGEAGETAAEWWYRPHNEVGERSACHCEKKNNNKSCVGESGRERTREQQHPATIVCSSGLGGGSESKGKSVKIEINSCNIESNKSVDMKESNLNSNLLIYYQNVRGLDMELEIFFNNAISSHYSCMLVTKSWLNSSTSSNAVISEKLFSIYRADRSTEYKGRGGGVLIVVSNDFISTEINLVSTLNYNNVEIEIAGVCVSVDSTKKINIITVSIPPNISTFRYTEFIDSLMEVIVTMEHGLVLVGDFRSLGLDDVHVIAKLEH